jgi:hypothetical protein
MYHTRFRAALRVVPESHERDGSEPRAHDDDELVTELRALLCRVDPMPAAVLVAAYAAFGGEP